MPEQTIGHVVQVMGPVLDIRFPENRLPALLNAIRLDNHGTPLIAEVAQQIGDNVVRCIAMSSTDGMVRGDQAVDTGGPITVPVGEQCLAGCSTCWASPSTTSPTLTAGSGGPSTVPRPPFRNSSPPPRFWKPASRWWT